MWRPRRDFAACVQVQKLHRHFLDRGAGLISLRCPTFSSQRVEARRWRLGGYVRGGSVSLDLVDAIERNIETVAALVLDDGNLDSALAHEHLLDPAINPDAVLEVHDVVAGFERGEIFQRCARDVPSCAAKASLATEYLVVGEHAITREIAARWHDEAAIEHTDRETRR